jgi:hypothetical protein
VEDVSWITQLWVLEFVRSLELVVGFWEAMAWSEIAGPVWMVPREEVALLEAAGIFEAALSTELSAFHWFETGRSEQHGVCPKTHLSFLHFSLGLPPTPLLPLFLPQAQVQVMTSRDTSRGYCRKAFELSSLKIEGQRSTRNEVPNDFMDVGGDDAGPRM